MNHLFVNICTTTNISTITTNSITFTNNHQSPCETANYHIKFIITLTTTTTKTTTTSSTTTTITTKTTTNLTMTTVDKN